MRLTWFIWGGVGIGVLLLLSSFLGVFQRRVDYNTQVKPILNKNCIACHGGVKKASGFSLLFKHEALAPAKSGKLAIVPGDADASEMIRRLTLTDPDERMPLDHPALTPDEITTLRNWIDQGAEWGDHWAYQRIEKPELPKIGTFWSRLGVTRSDEAAWVKNEIDYFILDKLRQEELTPSPEADKITLIRRVSLDLTGLPPTEKEVADFLADKSLTAYERVVDRLLNKPAYGERWAGIWLDLARYADTKGYERDPGRKIWRYRDYLIKAFNDDKPYNQFVTEQLAGDLLPNRIGEPATDEQLVATGFHRNTMNNDEGGTQDEEFRVAATIDRVNTTWEVFQGTTFACIQCHSHPYDPFTHDEYYKYLAFFNNARDEDVTSDTPTLRFYKDDDSTAASALTSWMRDKLPAQSESEHANFLRTMEPKINSHSIKQLQNASLLDAKYFGAQHDGVGQLDNVTLTNQNRLLLAWGTNDAGAMVTIRRDSIKGEVLLTRPVPKTGNQWNDSIQAFSIPVTSGKHTLFFQFSNPKKPKNWIMVKWVAVQTALPDPDQEKQYLALLNKDPETTPIMLDGTGDLARQTHIFERGNWLIKGRRVQPDVPKSFPAMDARLPRNRLGLARWMTSRNHPLTARVAVNRFWERLFGTGIVETVEDMGTQGIPPTHRDLLDYLAAEFMDTDHWQMKKLLKRMVMSATYRQQSSASPELLAKDPFNKLLARGPRVRLSAEQVRDQALAVSGLLSDKMFGPSVMPAQPDGIWQSPYDGASWKQSTGEDAHRRAMYTYWKRTAPYPSMVTFDSPSREFCQIRRLRTNTPLQALVTLNDPVYVEAAEHLAEFMYAQGKTPDARIRAGFRRVTLRQPPPRKLAVLTRLYRSAEQHYRQHPDEMRQLLMTNPCETVTPQIAALTLTANTMLNLDEVVTKE